MAAKLRIAGNLSGGVCSWAACKLEAMEHGPECLTLLFADTIIECDDLYRFLVESAANILGKPRPKLTGLRDIPPLDDMPARKECLAGLRAAAMAALPGLVWIADGRTPWEVFRDERFIGNSLVDPCSKILKRQLLDRWMNEHHGDARPTTRGVVGLGEWERHRFEGHYVTKGGRKVWRAGLAERMAARGWAFRAPLIYFKPLLSRADIYRWLDREDIEPPALSREGFDTNNCGGFCVKSGLRQAARLYYQRPAAFAWHAEQERDAQRHIDTDCTVFRREVDGKKVALPMLQLGSELAAADAAACSLLPSQPGCGCFTGDEE